MSRPRVLDQPPQTRSWPSGHSGSTQVDQREAVPGQQPDPVAERPVVLDVRHLAGRVVDLDVRRAVPVGLARDQPRLAGVVGEHPAGRVGDREGEPPARPQHPRGLGDRPVEVGHELQCAEGAEDDVERRRRRTAGGSPSPAPPGPTTPESGSMRRECWSWRWERSSPTGRPPRERPPSGSTGRPRCRPRARRGPATSPSTPADVLGQPLRPPHEPDVTEERAVGGLVLVGVPVPVGSVGPPRLRLVDRPSLHPHRRVRPRLLHVRSVLRRYRSRSRRIRWLASLPGEPITQPPGWVPEPHW